MKRKLKISIEQAIELLKTTPSLENVILENFPELKEPIVPDSWESLGSVEGYYIGAFSNIFPKILGGPPSPTRKGVNKNIFATRKQAESALAYAQLTQLMKATGDCNVVWNNHSIKYTITRHENTLIRGQVDAYYVPISFNTKKVRDEFFDKHQDLLKTFFQL